MKVSSLKTSSQLNLMVYCCISGLKATESEIKQGFRRAFAASWPEKLRYQVFFPCLSML